MRRRRGACNADARSARPSQSDPRVGRCNVTLSALGMPIGSVSLGTSGRTSSAADSLWLWDTSTGKDTTKTQGFFGQMLWYAWAPDSSSVAVAKEFNNGWWIEQWKVG